LVLLLWWFSVAAQLPPEPSWPPSYRYTIISYHILPLLLLLVYPVPISLSRRSARSPQVCDSLLLPLIYSTPALPLLSLGPQRRGCACGLLSFSPTRPLLELRICPARPRTHQSPPTTLAGPPPCHAPPQYAAASASARPSSPVHPLPSLDHSRRGGGRGPSFVPWGEKGEGG
jgi:hypothetical protein